jgi:hypothetical protein
MTARILSVIWSGERKATVAEVVDLLGWSTSARESLLDLDRQIPPEPSGAPN